MHWRTRSHIASSRTPQTAMFATGQILSHELERERLVNAIEDVEDHHPVQEPHRRVKRLIMSPVKQHFELPPIRPPPPSTPSKLRKLASGLLGKRNRPFIKSKAQRDKQRFSEIKDIERRERAMSIRPPDVLNLSDTLNERGAFEDCDIVISDDYERCQEARDQLTQLYRTIFDGPSPEFPHEDQLEIETERTRLASALAKANLNVEIRTCSSLRDARDVLSRCIKEVQKAQEYEPRLPMKTPTLEGLTPMTIAIGDSAPESTAPSAELSFVEALNSAPPLELIILGSSKSSAADTSPTKIISVGSSSEALEGARRAANDHIRRARKHLTQLRMLVSQAQIINSDVKKIGPWDYIRREEELFNDLLRYKNPNLDKTLKHLRLAQLELAEQSAASESRLVAVTVTSTAATAAYTRSFDKLETLRSMLFDGVLSGVRDERTQTFRVCHVASDEFEDSQHQQHEEEREKEKEVSVVAPSKEILLYEKRFWKVWGNERDEWEKRMPPKMMKDHRDTPAFYNPSTSQTGDVPEPAASGWEEALREENAPYSYG